MSAQISRPIGSIAFVSVLLASGFGVSLPTSTAHAADCLPAPNSPSPQNSHWYYRTDRSQQRQCWYLRAADGPSQQVPEQTASGAPPANSVRAASSFSLASFKEFMTHRGSTNLSDKDVEKLYAEFLVWNSHANN
jgi:hypothetical protein